MPDTALRDLITHLHTWTINEAYPVWWQLGADHEFGGFHESLTLSGEPTGAPRRGRIQPRQIFAFAKAPALGWDGPAESAVRHGLTSLQSTYQTETGTHVTLADVHGRWLDPTTLLYDQSFVLLALAAVAEQFPHLADRSRAQAVDLLRTIDRDFAHPEIGYFGSPKQEGPLLANPHMHLFEAAQEWIKIDSDGPWTSLAEQMASLATTRLCGQTTDRIFEQFSMGWTPSEVEGSPTVEPGHLFEWSHLLMAWSRSNEDGEIQDYSMRLFETAETFGVDRDRNAVTSLMSFDGVIIDPTARLWQQTERYRAALSLASAAANGQRSPRSSADYLEIARKAADRMRAYLLLTSSEEELAGLWRDKLENDGSFRREAVPASSFYHIVSAVSGPIEQGHLSLILDDGKPLMEKI